MRSILLASILPLILCNYPLNTEFIWGKYSLKFPGVGEYFLTFKSDSTFLLDSYHGIATIKNEGVYEVNHDSVFLTYTMPSIQNSIDTFANENHFIPRKDTLWIIDDNELSNGTNLMSDRYYQLEKHYKDGSVQISKEWEMIDSSLIKEDSVGNKFFYVLRGRRIKKGEWKHYDCSNNLIETDKLE